MLGEVAVLAAGAQLGRQQQALHYAHQPSPRIGLARARQHCAQHRSQLRLPPAESNVVGHSQSPEQFFLVSSPLGMQDSPDMSQ